MNQDLPTLPTGSRKFYDPAQTRKFVLDNAQKAFDKKLNSIETDKYKLHVKDLKLDDNHFTLEEQKLALMEKRDLVTPLKGTYQLIDKSTGKVVDEKKTIVANIPWITNRNTTIINGSEYLTNTQQRLLPGVYVRKKEDNTLEAHINPEGGKNLHLQFDPEKGVFSVGVGTAGIKLYGLLKGLGISDADMEKAWGKAVFDRNKQAYKGDEVNKAYDILCVYKPK